MTRAAVILFALAACSKASDESEAKKWQSPPPPANIDVPVGLSIAVDLDGSAAAPITADTLKATKPDFEDAERKAWLVATLVPSPAGATVEASAPNGVSLRIT